MKARAQTRRLSQCPRAEFVAFAEKILYHREHGAHRIKPCVHGDPYGKDLAYWRYKVADFSFVIFLRFVFRYCSDEIL
jgi:hypothetical protein